MVYNIYFIIVLECDTGTYGIRCEKQCGHCRDPNRCSNVNGSCLTGCEAGYKGNLCKTRKYAMSKHTLN